jgi:hypothetical protein
VFPAAIAAGLVTLLALPRGPAPGVALSYTKFLADVSAGTVRAVTISPAGQVTGSLAGGHPFTTTIPVALGGNGLAGDLAAHHVQVTATAAMSSSLLSVPCSISASARSPCRPASAGWAAWPRQRRGSSTPNGRSPDSPTWPGTPR